MRRFLAGGVVIALLVIAAVPFASAGTTVTTKHVDGTVKVFEPNWGEREWLARFEVRTTSGVVDFGYLELYGLTPGNNAGQIHEFSVNSVDYYRTSSGQGATLHMEECIILGDPDPVTGIPTSPGCFDGIDVAYRVSDGSPDAFLAQAGPDWIVESGNISIYTTGGQNQQ